MEEDKNKERTTTIVSIILIVLIIVVILIIKNIDNIINNFDNNTTENTVTNYTTEQNNTYTGSDNYDYYTEDKCFSGTYTGEYDIQFVNIESYENQEEFEISQYMTYSEYMEYCNKWNIEQKYNEADCNYIVFSSNYSSTTSSILLPNIDLIDLEYEDETTILYLYYEETKIASNDNSIAEYTIIIPTDFVSNDIEVECCKKLGGFIPSDVVSYKPIIYLYPEEETEVSVELGYPDNITVSYPKYETGWNVLAKTDGNLIDLTTGRNLYSLYYESTNTYNFEVTNEGFIVKGEDVSEFLEEKLEILGLNERESEEFIIYWLPVLQENEYNYIRFATTEEIEENMPLTINPNPDTIIRVLMTYKGLDEPIEVEEQELETPERTGFVAVEWGGTEIE